MKYSEQDMAALISEVETKFAEHLAKAESEQEQTIQKSEKVEKKQKAQAEPKEEVSEMAKSEEETFEYSEEDVAEMNKMYSSMTKSEKEAHYQSVKKALFGAEKEVPKEQPMKKSEEKVVEDKSEGKAEAKSDLLKSEIEAKEAEIAELKKSNEEIEGKFKQLVSALTKSVEKSSAPKQKAVTKIEYIAKSEEDLNKTEEKAKDLSSLSADEISARLNEKIRSGSLKKSERDVINQYYLEEGKKNIDSIKHLL